jgi:hypothetical protein
MDHLAEILTQLFAVLLAAKVGNELFKRIGQPPLIGDIAALAWQCSTWHMSVWCALTPSICRCTSSTASV